MFWTQVSLQSHRSDGIGDSAQHTVNIACSELQVSTHAVALTAVAAAIGAQHSLQSAWIVAPPH